MKRYTTVRAIAVIVGVGVLLGLASCGTKAPPTPVAPAAAAWPARMKVVVSIPPLKGLIEPLLPPGSVVVVLIPPGVSEHGYEPTPAQVKDAINADMLVWIGGMEPQVDALSKANQRAARTDVRLADALGLEVHDHAHDHKGEAHHDHGGGEGDPHVWLDPQKAKVIAQRVAAKVAALRPAAAGASGAGDAAALADALYERLDTLDKDYREGLAGAKVRTLVVGHDAYGWLAKRYDLKTVAISGLNANAPTPGDLQKAKETVKTLGLKAVCSEPQLSPAAAKNIADATGVPVLTIDPLGDGDYFAMMRANLKTIRAALGLDK